MKTFKAIFLIFAVGILLQEENAFGTLMIAEASDGESAFRTYIREEGEPESNTQHWKRLSPRSHIFYSTKNPSDRIVSEPEDRHDFPKNVAPFRKALEDALW